MKTKMKLQRAAVLLALCVGVLGGAWGEREEKDRGTQRGSELGLRALRAVSRGGAGPRPVKEVRAAEIFAAFEEGLAAGLYAAPHDEWVDVTDPKMNIDPIFTSQWKTDLVVTILATLATVCASASGIGGGGLLVPIYLLVMGWHIGNAVPLSNATIFGNAITNILINFPLRHPTADRPLVSFDLALILIPMDLMGSLIGVLMNVVFPQWLSLLCLLTLLLFTTYRTYYKGKALWEKESKERRREERRREAQDAAAGATKLIKLEDDQGHEVELQVVHGADRQSTMARVLDALKADGESKRLIFREEDGEKLPELEFAAVDEGARYHVEMVDALLQDDAGAVDYGFKAMFAERAPSAADHAKLIVADCEHVPSRGKAHLGKGIPIDMWTTEMVLSWVQTVADGCEALCYEVDQQMLSGTDLLLINSDRAVAHATLERLGVASDADRELLIGHVGQLAEQDIMLLVHSAEDLPWGSWNRSAEWVDGDEQLEDHDLDGWLEDDPNHPKLNKATYVASDSHTRVYQWDVEDVCRWLSKVTDYNHALKQAVRKNDIDGRSLMQLNVEDLKALNIPQLGPRLALVARIEELRSLYHEHEEILASERDIPYSTNLLVLFLCWMMLLVLSYLRGGGKSGGESPVAGWEGKTQEEFCGSATFWVLWWIGAPVLLVVTYFAGNYLVSKHKRKLATHFAFHEGDIKWTSRSVRLFPAIMIFAGILAGLLGVGGAMVTGPLMLELNVLPRVSTATSGFLIIFTSGVAAIAFVVLGQLRLDYAIWFAFVGAAGAALGLNIIGMLLKKYNRQSLVVWSLTLVFVLALIGTVVAGFFRISESGITGFREICA